MRKHERFTYFGQRISSDLCGPFPVSHDGHKYAIVFHDSYTGYIVVYTLPDKERSTVLEAFKRFMSENEENLPYGVGTFWTEITKLVKHMRRVFFQEGGLP